MFVVSRLNLTKSNYAVSKSLRLVSKSIKVFPRFCSTTTVDEPKKWPVLTEPPTKWGYQSQRKFETNPDDVANPPPDDNIWGFLGHREEGQNMERLVRLMNAKMRGDKSLPRYTEINLVLKSVKNNDDLALAHKVLGWCDRRLMLLPPNVFKHYTDMCIRIDNLDAAVGIFNKFGMYGMKVERNGLFPAIKAALKKGDYEKAKFFLDKIEEFKSPYTKKEFRVMMKYLSKEKDVDNMITLLQKARSIQIDLREKWYQLAKDLCPEIEDEEKKTVLESLCSFDPEQGKPAAYTHDDLKRTRLLSKLPKFSFIPRGKHDQRDVKRLSRKKATSLAMNILGEDDFKFVQGEEFDKLVLGILPGENEGKN